MNPSSTLSGIARGQLDVVSSLGGFSGAYNVSALTATTWSQDDADYVYFGWDAVVGDLDGDGDDDALVSYMGDPTGVAQYPGYLWFLSDVVGHPDDLADAIDDADAITEGPHDFAQFGNSLWLHSDFDGDGADDLFATTLYGGDNYEGQATLLDMAAITAGGSFTDAAAVIFEGDELENTDSTADWVLAGDFDGDGLQTLVVNQPAFLDSGSGDYLGRVFLIDAD
jgi:hypothetical protein